MENAASSDLTKVCTVCGRGKPLEEFYLRRKTGRRWSVCRECARERMRRYYHDVRAGRRRPGRRDAPPPRPLTKICTECGIEKYAPEFPLDRKTGRRGNRCRACFRAWQRRYYADHAEELRDRARRYRERQDPEQRRAKERRYRNKHRKEQTTRHRSRHLRQLGLVDVSDTCVDCGGPATEMHHEDYGSVVDLVSLCHLCHMRRHFAHWRKHGGGPVKYPHEYED